ncbi:hypothetical protein [uncultured Enterococcus sp.]|uniref:hypothetical protein n=1 Tax=uncultured Enterococcus sp. TaxID=167972 RepID=UPI002AA8012D|nr:hypothetical protein [uncultured Enterococcus sp.]
MMILTRKYVQFNDLVIDNYDMLESADLSGNFKTATADYSFGHGSYAAFKSKQQFSAEQSLSMSLKLDTRKFSCDQQKFYKDYLFKNIMSPGKLWAIEGEQLLWTNAFVNDFSETYSTERHFVSIDIDFVLYEGLWHKADSKKVFLQPYSICDFAEQLGFQEVEECDECCLSCSKPKQPCAKCLSDCEFLTSENSFCELKKDVALNFYGQCGDTYRIIYNCEAGAKIWGADKMLGHKICKQDSCRDLIVGQFYSDTIIDSEEITITIIGTVVDPVITLNGNTMQILGEYNGTLTLTANGEIYYQEEGCCGELTYIDINKLIIPEGNTFGFSVHQGMNGIIVETNDCCDMTCVYVKVDSVTI